MSRRWGLPEASEFVLMPMNCLASFMPRLALYSKVFSLVATYLELHSNKVTNSLYCAARQHIFGRWVQFVSNPKHQLFNNIRTAIKWLCGWMDRGGRQWRGPTTSRSLCSFSLFVMTHRQCKSTDGMSDPLFVRCRNRLLQFQSNSDLNESIFIIHDCIHYPISGVTRLLKWSCKQHHVICFIR